MEPRLCFRRKYSQIEKDIINILVDKRDLVVKCKNISHYLSRIINEYIMLSNKLLPLYIAYGYTECYRFIHDAYGKLINDFYKQTKQYKDEIDVSITIIDS
jgi:hypothetical protein